MIGRRLEENFPKLFTTFLQVFRSLLPKFLELLDDEHHSGNEQKYLAEGAGRGKLEISHDHSPLSLVGGGGGITHRRPAFTSFPEKLLFF